MWIKTHRCLVCMKDPSLINASSPRTSPIYTKTICFCMNIYELFTWIVKQKWCTSLVCIWIAYFRIGTSSWDTIGVCVVVTAWADPERGQGSGPPLENHKWLWFSLEILVLPASRGMFLRPSVKYTLMAKITTTKTVASTPLPPFWIHLSMNYILLSTWETEYEESSNWFI